jgi:hypothetical protein
MKVWAEVASGGIIAPYSKWRAQIAEEFKPGERLKVTVEKDRNGKFSSLFHLALSLIAKAINRGPAYATVESLKQFIKLRKGWYDVIELPANSSGQTHAVRFHSTAYAKMDDQEFHRFAREACTLIQAELAPWIDGAPEWSEALAIINQIAPHEVTK